MMARQLIVTADDFGFSIERNAGIMEAFSNGAVTSASLLLNCTGTADGINRAKHSDLVLGLHCNLTEGEPIGKKPYKTLTKDGIFLGMFGIRDVLNNGNVDVEEIEHEINCQIEQFEHLCGKKPAYVDGHQHIHIHPVVAPVFARVLKKHSIAVTRIPLEVNMKAKSWLSPQMANGMDMFIEETRKSWPVFKEYGIRSSDCFTGLSTMGVNMTVERLQANILEAFTDAKDVQHGKVMTCELMTHPGHPTPRDYGGFCWGTDDFGNSNDRIHEIEVLSSKAMKDFYNSQQIVLVSHDKLTI